MRAEGVIHTAVIHEAAQLLNHIGYDDRYYEDIWRACIQEPPAGPEPFGSAHHFAHMAFRYAAGRSVAHLQRMIAAHGEAPDQLAAIIDGFEYLFSHPPFKGGCALFNALTEEGGDPAIQAIARREMRGVQLAIEHVLRRGKRSGAFERDIQPAAFAIHITDTLEGAFRLSRSYQTTTYLRSAIRHLRRMGMMSMAA